MEHGRYLEDMRMNKNGPYYETLAFNDKGEATIALKTKWPGTADAVGTASGPPEGTVRYVLEYRRNDTGTWTCFVNLREADARTVAPRLLKALHSPIQMIVSVISVDCVAPQDYVPTAPKPDTTYWTLCALQQHVRAVLVRDYMDAAAAAAAEPAGSADHTTSEPEVT